VCVCVSVCVCVCVCHAHTHTQGVKFIIMQTPKAVSNAHLLKLKGAMGVNNR
jgi:hypothetical protein